MTPPDLAIRPFETADLARIAHLQPAGWEDIVRFFEFYIAAPFCHPLAGIHGDGVAALGCSIVNGATGWIAHIIVDESFRKRGFGCLITERCIDALASRGCETQLLIATALGEPIYRKLGFNPVSTYCFYRGPQLDSEVPSPHIAPLADTDRDALFALDAELTGESRRHVLEWFGTAGWGYFDAPTRALRGCFLPRVGEGLIIARDGEAGLALLEFKHAREACKTVVPAENAPANDFLAAHGFERFIEAPRMLRGKPVAWNPRALFSRIGGWYG